MEGAMPCFECLQRRIEADFSSDVLFRYSISDSALPFGSSAVIQICSAVAADNIGSEKISTQFVLAVSVDTEERGVAANGEDQSTSSENGGCQNQDDVGTSGMRMTATLSPFASICRGSFSAIEDLLKKYESCLIEDQVMSSLNLLVEGKVAGRYGLDFLNLVGCPAFCESRIPGSVRHPNITPILGFLKTPGYSYLLHPKAPYSMEGILHYSPKALESEWHARFLIYQIVSALHHIHSQGIAHGNICPSNVMLTDSSWVWLSIVDMHTMRNNLSSKVSSCSSLKTYCCMEDCPCQTIYADLKLSACIHWHSDFKRWYTGELSNYEYLLVLNRLAGRRWGDHAFHTVMPWVTDFSVKPDESSDIGWRDLKKSKWRLAKGDEQLDFTYSTSEIPHHVSDECLSELAVCSYKARRLPLRILRSAVRSVYEPNEYPSNMQRLYQWTPDECIPEFYSDSRIFFSLHSGMSDLAVPSWAKSPEEFILLHRDALESERVSKNLHHWIDITFGYKLSGQASIEAKNVMLPASDPLIPKSMGRRQLFTKPHPMRQVVTSRYYKSKESSSSCIYGSSQTLPKEHSISENSWLESLEGATLFCEYAGYLNPIYRYDNLPSLKLAKNHKLEKDTLAQPGSDIPTPYMVLGNLIDYLEVDDSGPTGFQELLRWKHSSSSLGISSEMLADDIFSVGCLLAEFYLKKPLFDPISIAAYKENGVLPGLLQELPPHVVLLVEQCIQKDWTRRPSAKCLLESQYFPPSIRSAYLFLAPLQLIAKPESRIQYAAKIANKGGLKVMGAFTAEMCAPYCLSLIMSSSSDVEAESALFLLKELLRCLSSRAIVALILPAIQKILQVLEYSHLKVSLLQDSFIRDLWNRLGKQIYLEKMHPLVISNLIRSPDKISTSAASVALIGSCEELGFPISVHQTILPLIYSFGKECCADAVEALVRIGGLLGGNFIIKHLLPLLRNVVLSCMDISHVSKPEPVQSWNSLALIGCLSTLDGLLSFLPSQVVVKELIQDQAFLHVNLLMQTHLDLFVTKVAANSLIVLCQRIGQDLTASFVLPQLKDLFDELAFSQRSVSAPNSIGRNLKLARSKLDEDACIENRIDLVVLLYPRLAALIGIEKLRQGCFTWLILEQMLERRYNWKWNAAGESSRGSFEIMDSPKLSLSKYHPSEYNSAKLLLNGVGWSIPQSQGVRCSRNLINSKQGSEPRHMGTSSFANYEAWHWFTGPASTPDASDFLGRTGGQKDELTWKIKASVIHSARAHPGVLRSVAICHDECTIYTGGVGPGFKGSVQKWELSRMNCISGYYGHDEVVNAVCVLSVSGRVASCDGTIHVWNGQTGKLIAAYSEASTNFLHTAKLNSEPNNMLTPNTLSGGILSNAFNGSLYTCMHHIDFDEKLVAGMGNGSIRFIDVVRDQKLHLWKSDPAESSFSSLISAICSCGSENHYAGAIHSPPWMAVGLSSGHCRLLDARSGSIIANWRAHDGYITKLAAPEDHLLVSSSFDKTLQVWDLRRNLGTQSNVFRGHLDGISSFSIWGQDVISVSRNKIGLTSLSGLTDEGGQHRLLPQTLYSADRGTKNLSLLSTVSVLPYSRLFLVGTEDGYLKVCC
ncbi:protein GFS12 isoform X4 [Dioscorea cayenensis subsp. rotundata]|uniref:Protein GFS12 isoform X4 n=1 Tax=Dioscorea cayennensis subsp. rotundata TaxID=55577 RepID=A0AB40D4W0_DIOCR|nr:protein GFS12 isoform X4 [Dioscorea cayenensis subsp. rotundata]